MTSPSVCFVLHAHLPYLREPAGTSRSWEERWLFEAIGESYLPVLRVLEALETPARIAVSFSPTLTSMLADATMIDRFREHLLQLHSLAGREVRESVGARQESAKFYLDWLETIMAENCDVIARFASLQAKGFCELFTTTSSHAYLPLVRPASSLRAQIFAALDWHRQKFGEVSRGFWLPECAFSPDLLEHLEPSGVRWTILDAHGLEHATPTPPTRSFAPITPPDSKLLFFGRDQALSEQIWSAKTGYPGDPWYREFHRDLSHDRDDLGALTIPPHSPPTGIKLCRVTGAPKKEYYEREPALERAQTHAADFVKKVQARIEFAQMAHVESPVIVCPFDFELFGHWWFEGPEFLGYLFSKSQSFSWATPSDVAQKPFEATPSASSWGEGGYHRRWLNPETAWMYPLLHRAGNELDQLLANDSADHENALRNLLLAQASDWAFLQRTGNSEFGRKAFYWYVQQATSPKPTPVEQFLLGVNLSTLFRGPSP